MDIKSNYKVGKPYKINGQWFYPEVNYSYDEIGIASWYGPNFHGRKTANGEIFDQEKVSAAHKTLPLPSFVRVTNLENNLVLEIRINDRGPFVRGRIIDLSKKAAEKLDILNKGTAKVRVQILEEKSRKVAMNYNNSHIFVSDAGFSDEVKKKNISKTKDKSVDQKLDEKKKDQSKSSNDSNFIETNEIENREELTENDSILIQVGAFTDIRNAGLLIDKLSDFKAYIQREFIREKYFYRVRIGPFSEISFADPFTIPNKAPTFTVSPSLTEICSKTPFEGAGTSTFTLSVSNSTIGSSAETFSPWLLSHFETVASVTDSPKVGTIILSDIYLLIIFSNISFCSARCLLRFPVAVEEEAFLPTYLTLSFVKYIISSVLSM